MPNKDRPAYIALARSFIRDLRYRRPSGRPLTELEATIWLIAEAAWKPRGSATRFGSIHNERAQLSITQRALAREWKWSKSKVHRFLFELRRDGTIAIDLAFPGPKTEAQTEPRRGYGRTLITLINYDKFQGFGKSAKRLDQALDQKVDQSRPELPGLIYPIASKPTETNKSIKSLAGSFINKKRPPHGKCWNGLICIHYATEDWRIYSADYEKANGLIIMPCTYIDGRARWFKVNGGIDDRRTG
jgi:hypothetical protein